MSLTLRAKSINESRNPMLLLALEDPFLMSCFIYLNSKNKRRGWPKISWMNTHWYTNILYKNQLTNSEEAFIYEKKTALTKVYLVQFILPAPLKVQQKGVLKKSVRFLPLDLKTELTTFESTFIWRVYVGWLYVKY